MKLSGSINHGSASGLLLGDLGASCSVYGGDTRSSVACTRVCVCVHEQGTVAFEAGLLPLLKSLSPSPIVPTGGVTGCLLTASSPPLSAAAPFLQAPASVQTVDREHL